MVLVIELFPASCIVSDINNGRVDKLAVGARVGHDQGEHNVMSPWSVHIVCPGVTVTCEAPFQPAANSSLVCSDGAWLQPPLCVPAKCTELPDAPRNGMVVAPNMEHGMVGKFEVGT